jgi:hypothetical protein
LVDLLKAEGFDIARRTVAKYREAIGIGSSVQRRRQKAIGARAAWEVDSRGDAETRRRKGRRIAPSARSALIIRHHGNLKALPLRVSASPRE